MNDITDKSKIINRLRTIKGHINGIEKMVEEEKGCKEILHQISAIEAAVKSVGKVVIKNCANEMSINNKVGKEDLEEILSIIFKYML